MRGCDFTLFQLGAYVAEKGDALSDGQGQMVTKFWKSQRSKIYQALAKQTCWQDKLTGVSWRVDVKTKSKSFEEVGQLRTKRPVGSGSAARHPVCSTACPARSPASHADDLTLTLGS